MSPLHIKLGVMKQFVKAFDKNGEWLTYLYQKFQFFSDEKLNEGIFVIPDKTFDFGWKVRANYEQCWEIYMNCLKRRYQQFLGKPQGIQLRRDSKQNVWQIQNINLQYEFKTVFLTCLFGLLS